MSSSTLAIGERIVARSEGGALETEYALFDPHEIELRSNNEPGTVREIGYRTTVALAKERLELDGITGELASLLVEAMRPLLLSAYARGPVVRKVIGQLDAALLFQAQTYDAKTKVSQGLWLDLIALAKDSGVERATSAFQAIHLAALIGRLPDETAIYLSTADYTKDRRPGERTHRRVVLMQAARLPEAIRALASKGAPSSSRESGASRSDLVEGLRTRAAFAAPEAREALTKLEREIANREMPARGPLADPELWAIERQLTAGETNGVIEKLEALDRARGRQPSTAYLRARASLMIGKEEPRLIAERVSALAMSMNSFAELELLAAQAWEQAGEVRRALPYARDLVANPQVDDELRTKAQYIITRAEGPKATSGAPSAPRLSAGQMAAAQRASSGQLLAAPRITGAFGAPSVSNAPPVSGRFQASSGETVPKSPRLSTMSDDDPIARERVPSGRPPAPAFLTPSDHLSQSAMKAQSRSSHPTMSAAQRISQTAMPEVEAPRPSTQPATMRRSQTPPRSIAPPPGPSFAPEANEQGEGKRNEGAKPSEGRVVARSQAPQPASGASLETSIHPPPLSVPKLSDLGEAGSSSRSVPPLEAPPTPSIVSRAPPSPSLVPQSEPPESEPPRPFMKGASQPPFRTDVPPARALPPQGETRDLAREPRAVERAEALTLPPGLHGEAVQVGGLPTTIPDARILFTQLSRELGREYKKQYGIELRTDMRSIEIMQRHLKERFPTGEIETEEEALDIRKHGAFLSEILARTLGAEWVDIALTEIGYWSMVVPPGVLVWPFGRVLRLVAMQHKERDLVSYFLELQARQMLRR